MMQFFYAHFPDLAGPETRVATLPQATNGIPAGKYSFVECYCTDPACDCRRVLFFVVNESGESVGVISFGFDANDPMRGPFLDPLHPQAPYAKALLSLTAGVVLADPLYVERLQRHYGLVKEKTGGAAKEEERPRKGWRKGKKRKRRHGW